MARETYPVSIVTQMVRWNADPVMAMAFTNVGLVMEQVTTNVSGVGVMGKKIATNATVMEQVMLMIIARADTAI